MISTWISIIKHLKGEDAIKNVEFNAVKDISMLRCMIKGWRRIQR
jgi:hypothetical protein